MLFKSIHCLMKELQYFFIIFSYIFYISLKSVKKLITTTSRPPVPCFLQILLTFNLYSGRSRVGLSVNNKQKVRQAMDKIQEGGGGGGGMVARYVSRNGLTNGGLKVSDFSKPSNQIKIKSNLFSITQHNYNVLIFYLHGIMSKKMGTPINKMLFQRGSP